MAVVEMVFSGAGGLGQWVDEVALSLEGVLQRHAAAWHRDYPITLRESLRLGLQQQIVGAHACPAADGRRQDYRVWLQLPEGGLRAWTSLMAGRVLAGCHEDHAGQATLLRRDVQRSLVDGLGPCLERPQPPLVAAGALV
jgi:hypothetical protein